jgi:AcrR family transcriptional regulator
MASKNITKELIFGEALALIKEGGMAALSMRNLAGRLGIKAPSLYVHIQSKAELILLLQAHTFKTSQLIGSLNPNVLTWQELLFAIMTNMRNFFISFLGYLNYLPHFNRIQMNHEKPLKNSWLICKPQDLNCNMQVILVE